MVTIISLINNKGGVGKTTCTQNLSVALSKLGYKVGIIDFDTSQNNLSVSFKSTGNNTLSQKLTSQNSLLIEDWNCTNNPNLFLLPNNKDILSLIKNISNKNDIIKNLISDIDYLDFIVIDNRAGLDESTILSLVASRYIIVVLKPDSYSLDGLVDILNDFKYIKKLNSQLDILGILLNEIEKNDPDFLDIKNALNEHYPKEILNSFIRKNRGFKKAQKNNKDIFEFEEGFFASFTKKGSQDYTALANEIISKIQS